MVRKWVRNRAPTKRRVRKKRNENCGLPIFGVAPLRFPVLAIGDHLLGR